MKPTSFSIRLAFTVFCLVMAGSAIPPNATAASIETGVRLLQEQLPAGARISRTECEPLARAVGRATLTHRPEAAAILSAALTGGGKDPRRASDKFSCGCVVRIFRVSIAAAPTQSSALLETASALYPDCAEEFTNTINRSNDKDAIDFKDAPAGAHSTAANDPREATFDPNVRGFGDVDPGDTDLTDRDVTGLGFGNGFGPGFPGAPGFIGSPASGGIALPPPVAVTSVVNG